MLQQNIKPRYEVEELKGTVEITRVKRDSEAGKNVEETVEVDAGYMVYFPAGHSIRVADKEELKRLGFDQPAELIDEETGDVVGSTAQSTLKRNVQHRAAASKRRKAHTTGTDANQGG